MTHYHISTYYSKMNLYRNICWLGDILCVSLYRNREVSTINNKSILLKLDMETKKPVLVDVQMFYYY